jgi:starch-binding outer membrane protein SusE/F
VDNAYKFTRLNSTKWEQIVTLTTGKEYLLIPEPGNWGKKYGVEDNSLEAAKTAGFVKPEGANFKTPNATGSYKIVVDFVNNGYTVTKQ